MADKKKSGLTAINLTKLTFDAEAAKKIKDHYYRFIYLVCTMLRDSHAGSEV